MLKNGVPTFVLEEERFNREKHTRKFPFHALKAAFDDRGLSLADIDVITTPWHMRSLWQMMFGAVREGFPASLNLVPPSARSTQSTLIVTMPNGLRWGLLWHFGAKQRLPKIVQVRHHDAHVATFFVSPFEEATILVMDGYGDETAQSAYTGAVKRVERVAQSHIFDSLGMAPKVRAAKAHLIPAAVHFDGTARLQTVGRSTNPLLYAVIEEFAGLTKVPVILNTSFNLHEPIVETPKDAVSCYMRMQMDVLVIGNFYSSREGRPMRARRRDEVRSHDIASAK